MMRPKTTDRDLPPRMLRRKKRMASGKVHISYYYNWRDESGKRREIPLGMDLGVAKLKWAELERAPAPVETGTMRQWVIGRDGVKRWADSGDACEGCRRCGGEMKPSKAIAQTYTGLPDFNDKEVVTLSPGGTGRLVECMKCAVCGWSVMPNALAQVHVDSSHGQDGETSSTPDTNEER